jgi:TPR repeat protein
MMLCYRHDFSGGTWGEIMLSDYDKARVDFLRGQYFERGEDVAEDLPRAVRLYRRAALRGLADAQHALGFLYATGRGVELNEDLAVAWFKAAAEQDHATAQHNLAVMYAEGRGVEEDEATAVYWFYRAALNGNDVARDWISSRGHGVPDEMANDR